MGAQVSERGVGKEDAAKALPPLDAGVKAVIDTYPDAARAQVLIVRALILDEAARRPEVGPVTETLKWGEPAYLTEATRSGTTIRLGHSIKSPDSISLFVNCRTSLVDEWRGLFGDTLHFIGNREVRFNIDAPLPQEALRHCISMALTYHSRKSVS